MQCAERDEKQKQQQEKKPWKSWDIQKNPNRKSNNQDIKQDCSPSALSSDDFHSPERADLHPDIFKSADYSKLKTVPPSDPTILPWSPDLNTWESTTESMRVLLRVLVSYFGNNQRDNKRKINSTALAFFHLLQTSMSSKCITLPTSAI